MTYVSVPRAVCDPDTLLFYNPYPNSVDGHLSAYRVYHSALLYASVTVYETVRSQQEEVSPLGVQPPPPGLELAASKAAEFTD